MGSGRATPADPSPSGSGTAGLGGALRSAAWRQILADALAPEVLPGLDRFLAQECADGFQVLPPVEQIFAALDFLEPEAVRVVILGQDPYPTPGHAHGLAFSYRGEGTLPRSLANIFREVEADLGCPAPPSGDLGAWAQQGVLLLNTVLTVRAGEAGSHRRRGWEAVTDAILAHLSAGPGRRIFLLWGNEARKKRRLIDARHTVLEAGHPSPLSIRYFKGCGHFSQTNALLDGPPIEWGDPAPDVESNKPLSGS